MTQIPSNLAISGAAAPQTARDMSKERETQRAAEASTASRQARSLDQAIDTVETGDADSRVFTDAEGAGSQGRAFEGAPPEQPDPDAATAPDGVTRDDDGTLHVDIEA